MCSLLEIVSWVWKESFRIDHVQRYLLFVCFKCVYLCDFSKLKIFIYRVTADFICEKETAKN